MRNSWILATLCGVSVLTACDSQPTATPTPQAAQPEATTSADSAATGSATPHSANESTQLSENGNADKGDATEPEMDYGDWLRLPDGINNRYTEVYPTLVRSSIAGDPNGLSNLAIISQQLAMLMATQGKIEEAHQFLIQSGKAMRAGIEAGASETNQSTVATIFFNEACVLSQSGQTTQALASLEDAMSNGYTNLQAVLSDDDLAAVRNIDGFEDRLKQWQETIAQKMAELAKKELATAETFPFTFTAEDISGTEQSLDALQGKVVIVDVWGTWCPPCRAEIPSFIKLQEKFGPQGLQMIGLNYERGDSQEKNLAVVVDFVKEHGINYPCILAENSVRAQIPSFQGYPTTLFIDKSGRVRLKAVGLHDYAYLEAIVTQLLSES